MSTRAWAIAPAHESHHQRGAGERRGVDPERRSDRQTEQQPAEWWADQVVHRQLGRTEPPDRAFEVMALDRRRHHGHTRTVDDRLRRSEQHRDDVDHHDRRPVEHNRTDEDRHDARTGDVQAHSQETPVETVGPGSARQDEEQPRQALRHRDSRDQARIGRHRGGEQRHRHQAEAVSEVRQRGGSPEQPEVVRQGRTEPSAPTRRAHHCRRRAFEAAGIHAERLERLVDLVERIGRVRRITHGV